MKGLIDQPITLDEVVRFLASTPFFDVLDSFERADVARILEVERFQRDEVVFKEGAPGDAWYIIFEGEVRVLKDSLDGPLETARLSRGACFGEMAVLDGLPRSANIVAASPLTTFKFRQARFQDLLEQGSLGAHKLVIAMARVLSKRHRALSQQIIELTSGRAPIVEAYQTSE